MRSTTRSERVSVKVAIICPKSRCSDDDERCLCVCFVSESVKNHYYKSVPALRIPPHHVCCALLVCQKASARASSLPAELPNLPELLLQASAADQAAVDVTALQKFLGVGGLHAASVLREVREEVWVLEIVERAPRDRTVEGPVLRRNGLTWMRMPSATSGPSLSSGMISNLHTSNLTSSW